MEGPTAAGPGHPLISPVLDSRLSAVLLGVVGLLMAGLALTYESLIVVAASAVLVAVLAGPAMYLRVYRRLGRQAIENALAVGSASERSGGQTLRWVSVGLVPTLVVLVVFASIAHLDELLGGMLALAGANLLQARWFASWEREHDRRLLHGTVAR